MLLLQVMTILTLVTLNFSLASFVLVQTDKTTHVNHESGHAP